MNKLEIALEAKLTTAERKALPDSAFGIPTKRSYPLYVDNDDSHLRNAITKFNFCPEEDRKELASNIVRCIRKLKSDIKITKNSPIVKYTSVPADMLKDPEPRKKTDSALESLINYCDSMMVANID